MPQHKHPLERDRDQPGTQPVPENEGTTNIGEDAGVFNNRVSSGSSHSERAADVEGTDSGMDPVRTAGIAAAEEEGKLPPPAAYRPDSVVRATAPDARMELERHGDSDFGNQTTMTKGQNAPTRDQTRTNYTVEDMDNILEEAPPQVFPDTPGGAGATPLSADRNSFINDVTNLGHFPSRREGEKWTRAVFNALRHHTYEVDDRALLDELKQTVRFGEAPEVQVEEMMWGGDFVSRFARMAALLQDWPKQEFYQQLAEEAHETPDDPWVDAAVHSFFGALKRAMGPDAERGIGNLGELQEVWDRV